MKRSLVLVLAFLVHACDSRDGASVPPDELGTAGSAVPTEVRTNSAAEIAAAATITAEDVARRIGIIAHDSMRGRSTPSPELEATATWLAAELESLSGKGAAPFEDSDWTFARHLADLAFRDPGWPGRAGFSGDVAS